MSVESEQPNEIQTTIENCECCRFAFDDDGGGLYVCRRYAPKPKLTVVYFDDEKAIDRAKYSINFIQWPSVPEDGWCGEWLKNNE